MAIFSRKRDDLETADRAPRLAWVVLWLGYGFWLMGVNGFLVLSHALAHAAHHPDPASGRTYFINEHGTYVYIRPDQFALYTRLTTIGGVCFFGSILALFAFFKLAELRYLMVRRRFFIVPILLAGISAYLWQA